MKLESDHKQELEVLSLKQSEHETTILDLNEKLEEALGLCKTQELDFQVIQTSPDHQKSSELEQRLETLNRESELAQENYSEEIQTLKSLNISLQSQIDELNQKID